MSYNFLGNRDAKRQASNNEIRAIKQIYSALEKVQVNIRNSCFFAIVTVIQIIYSDIKFYMLRVLKVHLTTVQQIGSGYFLHRTSVTEAC